MTNYVIFGQGRVGANVTAYLRHLGHAVSVVTHEDADAATDETDAKIEAADIVAAAIPDDDLQGWHDKWHTVAAGKTIIHFSGAVSVAGMYSYHPLHSFPNSMLTMEEWNAVAFACPETGPAFEIIFPGAANRHFTIAEQDRAKYHALAVISGNFASFLWNETAKAFGDLSVKDRDLVLGNYFNSIVARFAESPLSSMTGPMARRDRQTVEKNMAALKENPVLGELYEAFLNAAWPEFEDDKTP